jgi:hypothetical protein
LRKNRERCIEGRIDEKDLAVLRSGRKPGSPGPCDDRLVSVPWDRDRRPLRIDCDDERGSIQEKDGEISFRAERSGRRRPGFEFRKQGDLAGVFG